MHTGTRAAGHASKVDRDAATKHTTVEFVEKDDDEQVVTGVVMVPFEVDRQGDYETPETIEQFADDFADLYENGSADGGIMHAAWPSEWMDLDANVIAGRDELPEAVADADLADGTWVQQWRITDAGLWELIDDEIFQGFSIGARDVEWRGPMEQSELPEGVGVPDEYDDDDPVWELVDGITREVSTVDTPAVPEALVLAKDDADKALEEYLGDRDGFLTEMEQRGHPADDAERVWDVMSRAADVDGSDSPGKDSLYERIGKAAAKALPGMSAPDEPNDAPGAETQTRADSMKAFRAEKQWGADTYWVRAGDNPMDGQSPGDLLGVAVDMPEDGVFIDWKRDAFPDPLDEPHVSIYGSIDDLMTATSNVIEPAGSIVSEDPDDTDADRAAKEGRTLSRQNRESLFATIDASLDVLENAGVDHGMTRFTDTDAWAFDLSEHAARTWTTDDDGTDDDTDTDDDTTESMTDTNDDDSTKSGDGDGGDPFDDAPAWAKSLKDSVDENSTQINDLADKSADGDDADGDDDKDAFAEAPEWAKALAEQVDENANAVENIGKQAGFSTQVNGAGDGDDGGEADKSLAGVLRNGGVQ